MVLRNIAQLFRLDTDDPEVARAQFHSFAKQIPLLYLIMIGNAAAIAASFFRADLPIRTMAVPIVLCVSALGRAVWWLRQETDKSISDLEIKRQLRRTCHLAIGLTIGVEAWSISMYELGDARAATSSSFWR